MSRELRSAARGPSTGSFTRCEEPIARTFTWREEQVTGSFTRCEEAT